MKKSKKEKLKSTFFKIISIIFISLFLFFVVVPRLRYNHAVKLYEQREYLKAYEIFQQVNNIKDADQYIKNCENEINYEKAFTLFKQKDFEKAGDLFYQLADFKDSVRLYKVCCYNQAVQLFESQNHLKALPIFEQLGSFKDSDEYFNECKKESTYIKANNLMKQENLDEAAQLFKELGTYKDSEKLYDKCFPEEKYLNANLALQMRNYKLAYLLFEDLIDYKDSDKKANMISDLDNIHKYGSYVAYNSHKINEKEADELEELYTKYKNNDYVKNIYYHYKYNKAISALESGYYEACIKTFEELPEDYKQTVELLAICKALSNNDIEEYINLVKSYSELEYMDISNIHLRNVLFEMKSAGNESEIKNLLDIYYRSRELSNMTEEKQFLLKGIKYTDELDWHLFGKNAAGKVLVLTDQDVTDNSFEICTFLMDWLPLELIPRSFHEVEYIIYIEYSKQAVGKYSSGTVAMQQIANVDLINCLYGYSRKNIGTAEGNNPPQLISYDDDEDPPKEKSGNRPDSSDVRRVFLEAIKECANIKRYKDFEYMIYDDCITIHKYKGRSKTPVIPDNIDGIPVTNIQHGTFEDNEYITRITLPIGLKSIADELFADLIALEEVKLPSNVKSIGDYAFSGCLNLKTVILNDGLKFIGFKAFDGCTSLSEIKIPDSTYHISNFAFKDCSTLEKITLSNNLRSISFWCFKGCTNLKQINLPNKLEYIEEEAFAKTSISDIAIPKSLKYIDENAFMDCKNLKEVHIPETVTWIHEENFTDASMTVYVKEFSCAYSALTDNKNVRAKVVVVDDNNN